MPYRSIAQRAFFNANRAKLEAQGVDVDEWNNASKGKRLPKRKRTLADLAGASLDHSLTQPRDK